MKLRELRERAGFSQAAFAAHLDTTSQTVGRWESGKIEMTSGRLLAAAALLGCSIDELLGHRPTGTSMPVIQPGFWEEKPRHWGFLRLSAGEKVLSFPVSSVEQRKLSQAVAGAVRERNWIEVQTLDNRLLAIRWSAFDFIELERADEQDLLPAVSEEKLADLRSGANPLAKNELDDAVRVFGADAERRFCEVHVHYSSGKQYVATLTPKVAEELDFVLPIQDTSAFLCLPNEDNNGSHTVMLDQAALIEIPRELFRHLQDAYWDKAEEDLEATEVDDE